MTPLIRSEALRMRLTIAVLALGCLAGLAACGGDDDDDPKGPDMTRIAWARQYLDGKNTLPNQTPKSIGDALAGLEPTWVTGLVRLENEQFPTKDEVAAYDEIRDAVRAKAPDAEFDVELNALEFKTADELTGQMDKLREEYDNDGWFFDFFTPAYKARPEVVDAAIANAHGHGEWVGGNAFGWTGDPSSASIPPGADFIAVADADFSLDLNGVKEFAERVPILFHLRNNPDLPQSEGCIYMNRWSTGKREAYITKRAREQSKYDFSFAYPVFFPSCRASPHAPLLDVISFDSIRDPGMLSTIKGLMDKYD